MAQKKGKKGAKKKPDTFVTSAEPTRSTMDTISSMPGGGWETLR